jgi:hypothetical protein
VIDQYRVANQLCPELNWVNKHTVSRALSAIVRFRSSNSQWAQLDTDGSTTATIKEDSGGCEAPLLVPEFGVQDENSPTNDVSRVRRFRTKCTHAVVPDIARNFTWNDPFYENDADVIAAFDLDYLKLDFDAKARVAVVGFFYFAFVVTCIFVISLELVFAWFFLFPAGFYIASAAVAANKNVIRNQRLHVAIAPRGVYVDEAANPGSLRRVRREIIPFETITQCCVEDTGWFEPVYGVAIQYKGERRIIRGMEEAQTLVDILEATLQRSLLLVADAEVVNVAEAVAAEIV